jgi:hypothetical protein
MVKASMFDVIPSKVATSSVAVASEAFMAGGSPAHATAAQSTMGAAAASSRSTKAAATCFRTPSWRDEEQGGEGNDDEPTR